VGNTERQDVMLTGTVNFRATIKGNGLAFPFCSCRPIEAAVDQVEVEAPTAGDEIRITVHFSSVASEAEATALATKVSTVALNRLAFHHNIVIENARITGHQFSPVNPPPGVLSVSAGSYAPRSTPKTGHYVVLYIMAAMLSAGLCRVGGSEAISPRSSGAAAG
jgi:hypothetical protein